MARSKGDTVIDEADVPESILETFAFTKKRYVFSVSCARIIDIRLLVCVE
jgi:hypothetical protein